MCWPWLDTSHTSIVGHHLCAKVCARVCVCVRVAPSDPLTITALSPYTFYNVRMAAMNTVGLGLFSATQELRTQGLRKCGPLSNHCYNKSIEIHFFMANDGNCSPFIWAFELYIGTFEVHYLPISRNHECRFAPPKMFKCVYVLCLGGGIFVEQHNNACWHINILTCLLHYSVTFVFHLLSDHNPGVTMASSSVALRHWFWWRHLLTSNVHHFCRR